MNIAIDVRRIRDFGVGTYIRNLLQALAAANADHDYHLICSRRGHGLSLPGCPPNFDVVPS